MNKELIKIDAIYMAVKMLIAVVLLVGSNYIV